MDQILFGQDQHENQTQFSYQVNKNNDTPLNTSQDSSDLSDDSQQKSCPNCWATLEFLNQYYIPLIVAVGVIGNTISCVVFLGTHLRIRSSSVYLAALAVADVGFLLTLFLVWLASMGIEVFNQEGWCQMAVYMSSVCSFLSVWFIVAFTVERFIAIQYPLQRPHMCTVRRAKLTVLSLSLFAILIHSYLILMAGLVSSDATDEDEVVTYVCGLLPGFYSAMRVINSIDTIVTLILPLLLIIVMNSLIARQLYRFSRKHRNTHNPRTQFQTGERFGGRASRGPSSQSHSGSSDARSHNNNNSRTSNVAVVLKGSELNADGFKPTTHRSILSQRTQYTITKMLLLISTVFLILNLPSYVFRIYLFVGDQQNGSNESSGVRSEFAFIVQQFSMLLYYSNFSVNFLLYSMYGMTFRRALTQLVRSHLHMTGIWRTKSDSIQFK